MKVDLQWLADGWRAKGLTLASLHHGQVGDAIKELLNACAEQLEEEMALVNAELKKKTGLVLKARLELQHAEEVFRAYAEMHERTATEEGYRKGMANKAQANRIAATLALLGPRVETSGYMSVILGGAKAGGVSGESGGGSEPIQTGK